MRLLVDTHALLWAIDSPEKLGRKAREVLTGPGQRIFVSTVSLWEIAIKISLDRLDLDPDWREIIESGLEHMHGRWLTIKPAHCGIVATLPWWHRDPFDRMLVAQAISEDLALVTRDRAMGDYGVQVIW